MNQKIINSIIVGLMILLSIPTTAILASNNALPGDSMYPVKTSLESLASKLTSPSYQAHSELEIKLIQRRIEENQELLLSSGSTKGLELLVAQAEAAKEYILSSNTSQEIKTQAVNNLVEVLKDSQNKLEEQKQNLASVPTTNTVYKTVYKTETIYIENSPVSQGNSPEKTTPTTTPETTPPPPSDSQEAVEEISEAQEDIDEIIKQIETDPPINTTTPSITTPTIQPTTSPTPTKPPTITSCEQACDVYQLGKGQCLPNQACTGNVTHSVPGDQFCDSGNNKICCCKPD